MIHLDPYTFDHVVYDDWPKGVRPQQCSNQVLFV